MTIQISVVSMLMVAQWAMPQLVAAGKKEYYTPAFLVTSGGLYKNPFPAFVSFPTPTLLPSFEKKKEKKNLNQKTKKEPPQKKPIIFNQKKTTVLPRLLQSSAIQSPAQPAQRIRPQRRTLRGPRSRGKSFRRSASHDSEEYCSRGVEIVRGARAG